MADSKGAELSAKAQEALGLPEPYNMRTYSPFPFGGMNMQASPIAIADQEFLWIENFIRLGDGNFRTAWDVGSAAYTNPAGIVYYSFYTIGPLYYCALFLADGSAVQLDMQTLAQTVIGVRGFFLSDSGFLPYARQWGTQYLLICNRNTQNDYWIWDGAILYQAGTAAPNGVNILSGGFNYTSPPTITAYGGSGTGLTVASALSGGSIVELNITNPGHDYEVGDVVQLQFSGGSDSSAILTAQLNAGGVGGVNVTSPGSGYSTASVAFTGGGGTGAAGTVQLTGGVVSSILISSPGTGYTSAPDIVISGDGVGATAVALLAPEGVADVTVVNGGSGFTSVPLINFVGGGGAGAVGLVELTGTSIASASVTAGGSGYTSAPTITIVGGGDGTGAMLTANLVGAAVGSITVTDGGSGYDQAVELQFSGGGGAGAGGIVFFTPTSIASVVISAAGQFYTDAPAVVVEAGANNAAYATVSLMPFGVSGSSLETYLSRVWIFDPAPNPFSTTPPGGNFSVSAPGSVIDFATSDGGVSATNTDSFLQTRYVNVRQSSGYLYAFGDGSISVFSNVSTAGAPTVTSYNYQNVDPQAGLAWRDALQDFGRSTIIANATGIYGLYGGAATKISAKLDQLFTSAIFPPAAGALVPTSAIATIFNIKHYLCLLTVLDPDTNTPRNVMITWNEKDWMVTSQTTALMAISTQKVGSSYTAWGTDGTSLIPLFQAPSAALNKRLDTKFYGTDKMFIQKEILGAWIQAQDKSVGSVGISGTQTIVSSGLALQNSRYPTAASVTISAVWFRQPVFPAPAPYFPLWGSTPGSIAFVSCGLRFQSSSPDFVFANWVIGYKDVTAFF